MKREILYPFMLCLFFLAMLMTSACEEEDCCEPEDKQGLTDTWLLTEFGYSPGSGYFVEDVPPDPPMTLILSEDGTCSSNIEELEAFKYYLVMDDPYSGRDILAFFVAEPAGEPEVSELSHSYSVELSDDELRLYFRYCIEGCHLGFIRR